MHPFLVPFLVSMGSVSEVVTHSLLERGGGLEYLYHEPPKPTFLEVFMVNNLVFRWPKPLFFMVLGAHGSFIGHPWEPSLRGVPNTSLECPEENWGPKVLRE